ncbi:beta-galactosidase-2 [Coleophoma cylindrospora]|uniref:Beta-galactosidase n=1 Tax=Coleophoma cylindrospora TaxID=1849047 RepID=A0A3D8SQ13_9HELO|nr:beta-galactosidase-2 [Coleophoma cylindrospora]
MKSPLFSATALLLLVRSCLGATSFTYNRTSFLLDGSPHQIIGGQMDPQRIPYQLWSDRLYKARAMGLNTIFSYVFWDQIQPTADSWDMSGRNNITEYFRLAQEAGLNIVLRAGPYVCGEHEWGGFPAWLSEVDGMVVRSYNAPFLAASKAYIDHLASDLAPMMVTNGGPVIMVQIENEYGSYGSDHEYMGALRDMFKAAFGVTLYTNDGGYDVDLYGGAISGVLAETDGSPQSAFAARDTYVNDSSSLGPQLDGEYYTTWLDFWASNYTFETYDGFASSIATVQSDLSWVLNNGSSFSLYMFHGGTNFGFQNGADWGNYLEAVITSYDYGAPLDESGRPNEIYFAIRDTISSYLKNVSSNATIPAVPEIPTPIEIPAFNLSPQVALFDILPSGVFAQLPVNMEALNQSHGYTLYRHTVTSALNGTLQPGDYPRDRVLVYVNSKRVGVIDSTYWTPNTVTLSLKANDTLDLLIENMGRINYGHRIPDQKKGVVGNVTVGGSTLYGWSMYPLSMETIPTASSAANFTPSATSGPVVYKGTFDVQTVGDTFLELPGWTRGVVWVNGENLGRFWVVGPQQSFYLPGCYLKTTGNEIVVLELEPGSNATAVQGVSTRTWANNPDPDLL